MTCPKTMSAGMNRQAQSAVAITVKKTTTPSETGKPETSSESSKSYREAMEEFSKKHKDFPRREDNISAVLPQGSPGPLKEDHKLDDEELDEV